MSAAGEFDVEWLQVGDEACNEDIQPLITTTQFSSIFDTADPTEAGKCPSNFTAINAQNGAECLRLKEGMKLAASRLEFRRCDPCS